MLSRRAFLATGLALVAAPAGASPLRFVTTELVLTETALALGLVPLAAGNLPLYRRLVGGPALPEGVHDLGPLNEPNMELLVWLKPDLILAADWQSAPQAALARIAPVHWLQTLPFERPPLENARVLASDIAAATGREAEAAALSDRLDQSLAGGRKAMRTARPVLLAKIMEDGLNALVFSQGSLAGDVMEALGLTNALPDAGPWGAIPMGLGALLALGVPVLTLGPAPRSALLERLVRDGGLHLAELPPVYPAGGLPSALRLATALPAAMEALA